MKKILSLLLVLTMVFLLFGCSSDSTSKETGESEKAEISRGTIEGSIYKNDYLGFQFTRPDSWVYSTDEEIAAAMNLAIDNILGDNFKEALENNPVIYDMMVVDTLTRTNMQIMYENLKKSLSTNITIEQYVDALKQQFSGIPGMTVTFLDTLEKVKIGETEFTKCVCNTETNGVAMTQVFYLHKLDGYMASVIVTIRSGYTIADIEAMFQ